MRKATRAPAQTQKSRQEHIPDNQFEILVCQYRDEYIVWPELATAFRCDRVSSTQATVFHVESETVSRIHTRRRSDRHQNLEAHQQVRKKQDLYRRQSVPTARVHRLEQQENTLFW